MDDIFKTDIFEKIEPKHGFNIDLTNFSIPKNKDWYFMAKWNEIFEQYQWARICLRKAFDKDFKGIFEAVDNEVVQTQMKLYCSAQFYETALIYYNLIVDLSWTITYVSAEYIIYNSSGKETNVFQEIDKVLSLEDSYDLLRQFEKNVTPPNILNSPFNYLKKMTPEYEKPINLIIEFWENFLKNPKTKAVRNNYNYLKHRGKPIYKELVDATPSTKFIMTIDKTQIPSTIKDVQLNLNLRESIESLIKFDDNCLFPYLDELLHTLEDIIAPSPLTNV